MLLQALPTEFTSVAMGLCTTPMKLLPSRARARAHRGKLDGGEEEIEHGETMGLASQRDLTQTTRE